LVYLERGANVEARDADGNTALIAAAGTGVVVVARLPLDRGIGIQTKNNQGQAALDVASSKRFIEVVELLQERGAK
jgi:ankyrin repeat protein